MSEQEAKQCCQEESTGGAQKGPSPEEILKEKAAQAVQVIQTTGAEALKIIKDIIKTGNATRITIKNEKGDTILEVPLVIGAAGVLLAPVYAAIGAAVAVLAKCTIEVHRKKEE